MIRDLYQLVKIKKVIGKFKDELDGKVMTEVCAPRAKTYAFKIDADDTEKKKLRA